MSTQPLKVTVYPNVDYLTKADAQRAAQTQNQSGWNPFDFLQLPKLPSGLFVLLALAAIVILAIAIKKGK